MTWRGLPPGATRTFPMRGFAHLRVGDVFESPGGKQYLATEVTRISPLNYRVLWRIVHPDDFTDTPVLFWWTSRNRR